MALTVSALESLFQDEQFVALRQELPRAIEADPQNPDLRALVARLELYQRGEARALELLLSLDPTPISIGVAQRLANHLHCIDDREALAQLAARFGVSPEPGVGTSISACLIVKNESDHLDRCLSSLKGLVDEIVVVDTGSTDDTVEIARRHGAKLGEFKWRDDFSAARNASLELATGSWILWIDADEELTGDCERLFREAVIRPQFGGFNIQIVNFTADGDDSIQYVHSPIRLFRNHPQVRFEGRIHEQICNSLRALGLPGATLEGAKILHHGYRPSEMAAKGKVDRTVRLLEREVLEHPEDAFHWFNLCNAHFVAGRWQDAEHAGRQCASHLRENDPYGALNYQLLAGALSAQGKLERGLEACDEADATGYGGLLIDFERANILLKRGDPESALAAIDRCMDAVWPEEMAGDRTIFTCKRYVVRGQALACLDRFAEALKMFDVALKASPNYSIAIYSKAATLEKKCQTFEAYELFLQARSDESIAQICTKGAARCALRLGIAQAATKLFREAWEAQPDDYECWVGWTEAATAWGDPEAVLNAYESFVQRHEPSNEILINWGRALIAAGQHERALTCFTEAIKREPNHANAYFNCGDLLYQLGHYHDAAHLYETGLRLSPEHASGWFVLGNALAQLNLPDGARLAYHQALNLDPNLTAAQHNLDAIAA